MVEREIRKPLNVIKVIIIRNIVLINLLSVVTSIILDMRRLFFTPQRIKVAKRMNSTLNESIRNILSSIKFSKSFWNEPLSMACYLVNKSLS